MNILICNQWFPPFSYGGVAQYNQYLAEGLSDFRNNVIVISSLAENSQSITELKGIRIYRVASPNIPYRLCKLPIIGNHYRFINNLVYSKNVCRLIRGISQKQKIDIVEYADINGEGFFHRNYLKKMPYVIRCHTPYYLLEKTYETEKMPFSCVYLNWMEKKTIRDANGITAPSADLALKIEEWCGLKKNTVKEIPNPVDTEWFSPNYEHSDGDHLKLLFVNRIEKSKGIDVLADAIPHINSKRRKLRFIIVGKLIDQAAIERLKLKIYNSSMPLSMSIKGFVTKGNLRKIYQECDVFVNPAIIYESFSYANVQAMACGKPVVTSNMGGMPEIVGHMEGGLVFQSNNGVDLADKINLIVNDDKLRELLGQNGLRKAKTFTICNVVDQILTFYKNII